VVVTVDYDYDYVEADVCIQSTIYTRYCARAIGGT